LLDAGSDDDKVALVLCGFCSTTRSVEPAGRAFHAVHEKPKIEAKRRGKDDGSSRAKDGNGSDDEQEAQGDSSWRKKRKEGGKSSSLKLGPLLEGEDLYKLLEVDEGASLEQVKKQYRKMVLLHHPDKKKGAAAGAQEKPNAKTGVKDQDKHFIKIQEAYEVLSDVGKRRSYDSSLDFDDSLPKEVDESKGFYETFALFFRRNGRFSQRLPVPELGDENTDIAKVHKFYDFWFNFETWRDFSVHDEYNLEDSDCREERRWMERENQRGRKKYDSDERKRIMQLAESAERFDPRIRAEREEREKQKREEKEKRARVKQDEVDAKQQVEEEKIRKVEQEQAEREEKERQEKEDRKQKQQASKTLRQRLKKAVQSQCKLEPLESEELQELCLTMEAEQLEDFCCRLEALKPGAKSDALVRDELTKAKRRRAEEQEELARQKQDARKRDDQKATAAKEAAAAGVAWTTEELGVLAKGLVKFPGGLGGRWALITQLLESTGYPRTEKEVIEKTKGMSQGMSLRAMGSRATQEDSFQAAKAALPKAAATPKAAPEPVKKPEFDPASREEASAAPAADWSTEQQQALEVALKRHPASLEKNERWKLIAEDVPGKKKTECVERFKFLREQLSQKAKS